MHELYIEWNVRACGTNPERWRIFGDQLRARVRVQVLEARRATQQETAYIRDIIENWGHRHEE